MNREYNISTQLYVEGGSIDVLNLCTSIMVTNVGDTIAEVNGMVLFPSSAPGSSLGDSRTIAAHDGDLYTGNLELKFRAPVGTSPLVEIVQVYYREGK